MELWERIKRLARLKWRRWWTRNEDPLEILNRRLHELTRNLNELERSRLRLGESKIQLEIKARDMEKLSRKYHEQALKAARLDQDELAMMAIRERQRAQQSRSNLVQRAQGLAQQLMSVEHAKESLKNQIDLFGTKREELQILFAASKAELRAQELRTDISSADFLQDLQTVIGKSEEQIREIQAQVEATKELERADRESLAQEMDFEDEDDRQLRQELQRMKRELGEGKP